MTLDDDAPIWAKTIIDGLNRPFPWGSAHQSSGPDDVDVTPWRLHPAFYGCLDWHSSVHMQWSAVTLLRCANQVIDHTIIDALTGVLNDRLNDENARVEAEYLRIHRGYERPYGWGWQPCSLPSALPSRARRGRRPPASSAFKFSRICSRGCRPSPSRYALAPTTTPPSASVCV
ncbi:hypothetical protein JCM18920_2207 [Cutibacterium acnes JCM 18920]|nr:hypothetical protein JCM18920_2207 [Cutibacterium acnes JCM 18920]